jgi:phage gpG-like protein
MTTVTPDELVREFDAASRRVAGDHTDLLQSFVPLIAADVQSNFDNSGTAGGIPWPSRKGNKPHPLLRLSGALEAAATGRGAGHIQTIQNNELTYGVGGIIYAARQNYGDVPGSRDRLGRPMNIPAREYMAISEGTVDELTERAADAYAADFAGA